MRPDFFSYKVKEQDMYTISFKGLSLGAHTYDWTIDNAFFAKYEMSEISAASIEVQLTLMKHSSFLELRFEMNGWADVICDRCLDALKLDIKSENMLYVKFGELAGEDDSDDNDVIILPYSEDRLNVAQYLYEFAHLNLPIRRVHLDKNDCNKDMICKLEQYLVEN